MLVFVFPHDLILPCQSKAHKKLGLTILSEKIFTSLKASDIFLYFIFLSKDNAASKNSLQESLSFYSAPSTINNLICQSASSLQRSQHHYLHLTERKLKQHSFPNSNQETMAGTHTACSLRVPLQHPACCNTSSSCTWTGHHRPSDNLFPVSV